MKKVPPTDSEQNSGANQAQLCHPNQRPYHRPYHRPRLWQLGDLRDLTLGGSGDWPESGGGFIPRRR